MTTTIEPLLALTASDLMSLDVITIPQEMSLRAAADLLFQHQISGAPVVDTDDCCIGVLCATDFVHWAKEGGNSAEDAPLPACPYQVKGQWRTGEEGVICMLLEGDCPLQDVRPTTAGRHIAICRLRQSAVSTNWQQVTKSLPVGAVRRYMTAEVVTVEPQTPLPKLARTMIDAHIRRVIVVDGQRKPVGVVSATDILTALAYGGGKGHVPILHRRTRFLDRRSEQEPTVVVKLGNPAPNGKAVSEEAIRLCAYQKWEGAGKPNGDAVKFWLEAERELSQTK